MSFFYKFWHFKNNGGHNNLYDIAVVPKNSHSDIFVLILSKKLCVHKLYEQNMHVKNKKFMQELSTPKPEELLFSKIHCKITTPLTKYPKII